MEHPHRKPGAELYGVAKEVQFSGAKVLRDRDAGSSEGLRYGSLMLHLILFAACNIIIVIIIIIHSVFTVSR